jgi:mono/diheme cytochrome c family protein
MKFTVSHMRFVNPVILLSVLALFFVIISGCYNSKTGEVNVGGSLKFELPVFPQTGGHAVLVFTEMHYSQSYRSQEIPRLLPPEGSVPITGAEVKYTNIDKYKDNSVPIEVLSSYNGAHAAKIYEVNCQVCHGVNLDGMGPIVMLESARGDGSKALNKGSMPVNLNSDRVRELTDGEIFGYITWGGRAGLAAANRDKLSPAIMPQFTKLLTVEERWELVKYIRERIGTID